MAHDFYNTTYLEYIPFDCTELDDDWTEAVIDLEWEYTPGTAHTWDHPGDPCECSLTSVSCTLDNGIEVDLTNINDAEYIPLSLAIAWAMSLESIEEEAAMEADEAAREEYEDDRY
jgi:hypothetical protein